MKERFLELLRSTNREGIEELIKFLENKELKKMITVDNYKLVERVNKNDIIYLKREDVNEEEITSKLREYDNLTDGKMMTAIITPLKKKFPNEISLL